MFDKWKLDRIREQANSLLIMGHILIFIGLIFLGISFDFYNKNFFNTSVICLIMGFWIYLSGIGLGIIYTIKKEMREYIKKEMIKNV